MIKQLKRKRTGKPDSYNNVTVKQTTSKTVCQMLNTQLSFTFTTLELARQYLQKNPLQIQCNSERLWLYPSAVFKVLEEVRLTIYFFKHVKYII